MAAGYPVDWRKQFEAWRFDERFHLGLGDIRMPINTQFTIISHIEWLEAELKRTRELIRRPPPPLPPQHTRKRMSDTSYTTITRLWNVTVKYGDTVANILDAFSHAHPDAIMLDFDRVGDDIVFRFTLESEAQRS